MKNEYEWAQSVKDIQKAANDISWFRDSPNLWPSAALPLAYAVACVKMVSSNS